MSQYIIAEVGSNWCRYAYKPDNLRCAKTQIEMARASGAHAVKFQLFTARELYGFDVPAVDKFNLPREWVGDLAAHCSDVGIDFLCTPFSRSGVDLLEPFVERWKIASSEMGWVELIDTVLSTNKPVIVSTGGHDRNQICALIKKSPAITPLCCVVRYPAEVIEYDFNFFATVGHGRWGVSDHTRDGLASKVGLCLGATVFERHFDALLPSFNSTPDSAVSAHASEFKQWVMELHQMRIEQMTRPDASYASKAQHNRRLVTTAQISKGDELVLGKNCDYFRLIRPVKDFDRHFFDQFNSLKAGKDLTPNTHITTSDVLSE